MKFKIVLSLLSILLSAGLFAQDDKKEAPKEEGYQFEITKQLPATPVKDQYRSGTCWSFSGLSFLESELLRTNKGEFDLSEMFVVRQAYSVKAKRAVRMHGSLNFGGGGAFHDVTLVWDQFGIVPNEAYKGLEIGEDNHIHGEMDAVLDDFIKGVIENKNKKLTPIWHKAFDNILDAYLGDYPEKFSYKGKEYTPQSFAKELGLDMNDYVEISSYTHHLFYEQFIIEVPDNWAWGQVYNVPLDEMMQIIDNSIDQGYTVGWASDVSEKGFAYRKGIAVVPEANTEEMSDSEMLKWQEMSEKDKQAQLYKLDKPGKEKAITQELRQQAFDNYETTDDHGMHIIGTAKDQNGNPYYYVKNSWAESNLYDGYFYASVPFVQYKTMSIMVHKDAIPKTIKKKLGLK
ncbi:MAG: C1 family peptidase [Bacteroidales bacterium]|nr:C1 family peptidase [Bacteroidales bacterium]MCF8455314.1 C1 family peptidase [Bacteroidales bacterium]